MTQFLTVAGNVLLVAGAVVLTVFVVSWHITRRWWETSEGRMVMTMTSALAATLDLGLVRVVTGGGDATWFLAVRTALFALIPWSGLAALWLLFRPRWRSRRGESPSEPSEPSEPCETRGGCHPPGSR